MTTSAIIRFLKSPFPHVREWDHMVGKFDVLWHIGDRNQYPDYPVDTYRMVAIFQYLPRSWPRNMPHIIGSWSLWQIVAALECKGFRLDWKYPPIHAIYSATDQPVIDVQDGWHNKEAATK